MKFRQKFDEIWQVQPFILLEPAIPAFPAAAVKKSTF